MKMLEFVLASLATYVYVDSISVHAYIDTHKCAYIHPHL